MAYTIENVDGCTKKFCFDINDVNLDEAVIKALKDKQKTTNFKGYRKGKVPLKLVKELYGKEVETKAMDEFASMQLFTAMQDEKLRPVTTPYFVSRELDKGSLKFEVMVEIFPEIVLGDWKGLSFEKENSEVLDKDLDDYKNNIRDSKAVLEELADGTLAKGLFGVFNLVVFEGEEEVNRQSEVMIGIGKGDVAPNVEENLIGMKASEKKSFEAELGEGDDKKSFKYEVELLEVKEKKLPELTDELLKELGEENLESFEKRIKEQIGQMKEERANQSLDQAILEKLVELAKFDVPQTLKARQIKFIKDDVANRLKSSGMKDDQHEEYFSKWGDELEKKAEFQVRSALVLDKLAEDFKIEVNDDDLDTFAKETAQRLKLEYEDVRQRMAKEDKNSLLHRIREDRVLQKFKDSVSISSK